MTKSTYKEILVPDRIRESTQGIVDIVQAAESDRARVIYSTAFRRLQGKTQVFPLDENAAIRTRLTHSLEVAHVGKYLASSVIESLEKKGDIKEFGLDGRYGIAFVAFVETACLLHDIGNPPFGHFGEMTIARWFSQQESKFASRTNCFDDFLKFDGNPQGFRIATRLSGADSKTGLNLTFVQLASMLKYVGLPHHVDEISSLKKPGAFRTERQLLEAVCEQFKLKKGRKFPLAYLMEAADDISYCLSDIEDGFEKGLLGHEEAIDGILEACNDCTEAQDYLMDAAERARDQTSTPIHIAFRSDIIRHLVSKATEAFIDKHEEIIRGSLSELIEQESAHGKMLNAIKEYSRHKIYNHRVPQGVELTSFAVITGLLDSFLPLLEIDRADLRTLLTSAKQPREFPVEFRLLRMLAKRHVEVYKQLTRPDLSDEEEWGLRCHMIVDYISGMTDRFAFTTYQRLSGIRLSI